MKRNLLLAVLTALLTLVLWVGTAHAQSTVVVGSAEGESFTAVSGAQSVKSGTAVSGGQYREYTDNVGASSKSVALSGAADTMSVRLRGLPDPAAFTPNPEVQLFRGGCGSGAVALAPKFTVASTVWATYTAEVSLTSGTHTLCIKTVGGMGSNQEVEFDEVEFVRAAPPDADSDGIEDSLDNCVDVANQNQTDTDDDGQGDACDSTPNGDTDGDGVDQNSDNCPNNANPNQEDNDNDGQGNVCDPTPNGEAPVPSDCDVVTNPGDDLVAKANSAPAGSKICVKDGNYSVTQGIPVQGGDHWFGVYNDGSRPTITWNTSASGNVMDVSGSGATVENIHNTGAQHTRNVTTTGRGIHGGTDLTLRNVRMSYNENQGAGGQNSGLRVYDSTFDHNGNADSSHLADFVGAAGIKSVNSMYIYNSRFEDNYWNGVWCDIECNTVEIHDSVFLRNGKAGFHYEISSGPSIFEGNLVQDNGFLAEANRHTGLLVVSSRNLQAFGNTFGGNRDWGAQFIEDSRDPVTGNINFYDNTMNGDALSGCNLSGVNCANNTP